MNVTFVTYLFLDKENQQPIIIVTQDIGGVVNLPLA